MDNPILNSYRSASNPPQKFREATVSLAKLYSYLQWNSETTYFYIQRKLHSYTRWKKYSGCIFPTDLAPNGIQFGARSVGTKSTTNRAHENLNAEEKLLRYVPTPNASESVGNGHYSGQLNIEFIQKCTNAAHPIHHHTRP